MSLGSVGMIAAGLLSQPLSSLSSLLSGIGNSQSTSSTSGASSTGIGGSSFASCTPSISNAIGSTANNLTGSTAGSLSSQVMSTLLQAQEAGSSATQSATGAASQAGPSAQQPNGNPFAPHHQFAMNALNQLLQGLDQTVSGAVAGASSLLGSASSGSLSL
jgi:hypothetical protein